MFNMYLLYRLTVLQSVATLFRFRIVFAVVCLNLWTSTKPFVTHSNILIVVYDSITSCSGVHKHIVHTHVKYNILNDLLILIMTKFSVFDSGLVWPMPRLNDWRLNSLMEFRWYTALYK